MEEASKLGFFQSLTWLLCPGTSPTLATLQQTLPSPSCPLFLPLMCLRSACVSPYTEVSKPNGTHVFFSSSDAFLQGFPALNAMTLVRAFTHSVTSEMVPLEGLRACAPGAAWSLGCLWSQDFFLAEAKAHRCQAHP